LAPLTAMQNIKVCFRSFYKTLFSQESPPLDKDNLNEFKGEARMKKKVGQLFAYITWMKISSISVAFLENMNFTQFCS
jgi:hypothetical protein